MSHRDIPVMKSEVISEIFWEIRMSAKPWENLLIFRPYPLQQQLSNTNQTEEWRTICNVSFIQSFARSPTPSTQTNVPEYFDYYLFTTSTSTKDTQLLLHHQQSIPNRFDTTKRHRTKRWFWKMLKSPKGHSWINDPFEGMLQLLIKVRRRMLFWNFSLDIHSLLLNIPWQTLSRRV